MTNKSRNDNVLDRIAGKRDVRFERKKELIKQSKDEKFKIKTQYKRMLKKEGYDTAPTQKIDLPRKKNIAAEAPEDNDNIKSIANAQQLYKQKQQEIKMKRAERQQQAQQRNKAISDRIEKKKKMNQKTPKGQPLMKNQIKNLLSQIKNTI